jgi:hypothetical protein
MDITAQRFVSVGSAFTARCALARAVGHVLVRTMGRRANAVERGVVSWTNVPVGHAGGHSPPSFAQLRLAL